MISKAHTLLNDAFNNTDPEADFEKWAALGARPYFLSILEQPSFVMACVLRCQVRRTTVRLLCQLFACLKCLPCSLN